MRLDVNARGSYPAWKLDLMLRCLITHKGHVVKMCLMADEERGELLRYTGRIVDGGMGREAEVEALFGNVKIIDPLEVDLHEVYTRCDRG